MGFEKEKEHLTDFSCLMCGTGRRATQTEETDSGGEVSAAQTGMIGSGLEDTVWQSCN